MSWHFLERWVEKANQHSTLIGKFWITFLIVGRMVIVATVGDRVYSDEQSEFKCNTLQPGCTNVCFNNFSPISHLRFWSFQILFVATPSVMFVIYSAHKTKVKKANLRRTRTSSANYHSEKDTPQLKLSQSGGGGGELKFDPGRSGTATWSFQKLKKDQQKGFFPPQTATCREGDGTCWEYEERPSDSLLIQPTNNMIQMGDYNLIEANKLMGSIKRYSNDASPDQNVQWRSPCHGENFNKHPAISSVPEGLAHLVEWTPHLRNELEHLESKDDPRIDSNESPGCFYNDPRFRNQTFDTILYAPPQYPGFPENEIDKPKNFKENCLSATSPTELRIPQDERRSANHKKTVKLTKKPKNLEVAEHFRWYVANVFARLCSEAGFTFLQILLFGWSVPKLYKCRRWPCPNVVDCFVSRPTEKTIFLWFMFIYSCICVLLNVIEIFYLCCKHGAKRNQARSQRSPSPEEAEKVNEQTEDLVPFLLKQEQQAGDSLHLSKNWVKNKRVKQDKKLGHDYFENQWTKKEDYMRNRSKDFVEIFMDSDDGRDENIEINLAHVQDEEINEIEQYDATNADFVDFNIADGNDDAGQEGI